MSVITKTQRIADQGDDLQIDGVDKTIYTR